MYFRNAHTILVQLGGGQVWQSSNEGYTWSQILPEQYFVAMYMNPYWDDRAWLITATRKAFMTTDTGKTWIPMEMPLEPNTFGVNALSFHPKQSDWLIWTGSTGCSGHVGGPDCRTEAFYSTNHGRKWNKFESYVRTCTWARDKEIKIDEKEILCESYRIKKGNQVTFSGVNPLELVAGKNFFSKREVLFKNVVGFARFSEYLLVAEVYRPPYSHESAANFRFARYRTTRMC